MPMDGMRASALIISLLSQVGGDGLGARLAGEVGHVDVGNSHRMAPIFHVQAELPLPQLGVGPEAVVVLVERVDLAQILLLQAGLRALRVDAGDGVSPQTISQTDVLSGAGAAGVDDVLGVGGRQAVIARGQTQNAVRVDRGVTIDQLLRKPSGSWPR